MAELSGHGFSFAWTSRPRVLLCYAGKVPVDSGGRHFCFVTCQARPSTVGALSIVVVAPTTSESFFESVLHVKPLTLQMCAVGL